MYVGPPASGWLGAWASRPRLWAEPQSRAYPKPATAFSGRDSPWPRRGDGDVPPCKSKSCTINAVMGGNFKDFIAPTTFSTLFFVRFWGKFIFHVLANPHRSFTSRRSRLALFKICQGCEKALKQSIFAKITQFSCFSLL